MAIQNRNTLSGWAVRGWKPLAQQVRDWFDSFWHKEDSIPINKIEGLSDVLNSLPSADGINQILETLELLFGQSVPFAAPGIHTLADGHLLEKIIIKSATDQSIKIGNTADADDLMPETLITANVPHIVSLDLYAQGNRDIYFSGFAEPITIIFYKR